MPLAVALFSGGLDSMLAVRILQEQGFTIEALNVVTLFESCVERAGSAAAELHIPLTVRQVGDDYVELVRRPAHGHGTAVNPCIDCRIYMMRMAKDFMEENEAIFVFSGEVAGQRPMSQKQRDLARIERAAGLEGRLLRPLSAQLLRPTLAEQKGIVDRARLHGFCGRGRKPLMKLAGQLGIQPIPKPSTGCRLTERSFAPRVRDLIAKSPDAGRWQFEVLNAGRHFRLNQRTKVVLGRNEHDNDRMRQLFARKDATRAALVEPLGFPGPVALVLGNVEPAMLDRAAAMILDHARRADPNQAVVRVTLDGQNHEMAARPDERIRSLKSL